jgi:RNA polymerase sigma-70 factor, ECF subfamily
MSAGDDANDQAVVAAVLAGDRERFAILVERYQQRVFNAMWRACGSRDEAEELTQAAFCRAYFALHTYKPAYRFSTWLFQIAFNLAINAHKRRDRPPLVEPPESGPSPLDLVPDDASAAPEAMAERRALQTTVRRAWQRLGPDYRLMIEMRYIQQLSHEEICQATGLPLGTVKSRLARARQRLAEILARESD